MRLQIRSANKFDKPIILDLLREYRSETPLPELAEANDADYVGAMVDQIIAGKGIILLAEDVQPIGMVMAMIAPNIWRPDWLVMQELAYWVRPDKRGGSAGYRLLSAYTKWGNTLKGQGKIGMFTISKMVNSPDLKYNKFGFAKLEETWKQ